jgi:hypothetical protein
MSLFSKSGLLIVGLVVGISSAWAAQYAFQDKGESSIEVTQDGQTFTFKELETNYLPTYSGDVYKIITTSEYSTNLEGATETSHIERFVPKDGKYSKLWALDALGSDFRLINDEIAAVTEQGCCGAPNINQLYSIEAGTYVTNFLNEDLIQAYVPNSSLSRRYLAAVRDDDAPNEYGDKTYVGSVGYFSKAGLVSLIRIYMALPQNYGSAIEAIGPVVIGKNEANEYGDKEIVLFEYDGQEDAGIAFSGFGIKGKLLAGQVEESFAIMVSNDKIDAGASKFSAGLEAVVVK